MAKEVYYFSHDSNARHDPKCSALIAEFGAEAYGIFWMVIEILSEQENYKLKKFNKLYEGLGRQLWIDPTRLRSIIEAMLYEYELLVQDDEFIWSDSLLRRMDIKEEKRQKKIEAGRKGGKNSGQSRKNKAESKQNEAPLQKNEANEANEIKLNEIILNKEKILPLINFHKITYEKDEQINYVESYLNAIDFEVIEDTLVRSSGKHINYLLKTLKNLLNEGKTKKESLAPKFVSPIEQEAIIAKRKAEELKNHSPLNYEPEFKEAEHASAGPR